MSKSRASRSRGSLRHIAQLGLAAAVGLGCSPSGTNGSGTAAFTCVPGQTAACSCGVTTGMATCGPAGVMSACWCALPTARGAGGAPAAGGSGTAGSVPVTGQLPCGVASIISTHCLLCHSDPPQFTAPMPLTTWADFHAMGKKSLDKKVYEAVASRIQSTAAPMPPVPNPPLSDSDKAALLAWINAGAPPAAGAGCDLPGASGGVPGVGGAVG